MADRLTIAVPSKGRLMEDTVALFKATGMSLERADTRGYRGTIPEIAHIDVMFISASEIAAHLGSGQVHLGVTGMDLVRERVLDETAVKALMPLGFGHADVVVAVPACWVDARSMRDIADIAPAYRRVHGRPLRVATKYTNLTRSYFSQKGVSAYRIVESLGATEGTPAAGTAEIIVDITSTGSTLKANHLKILEDGVILRSEATLVGSLSRACEWSANARAARTELLQRLGCRVAPAQPASST